MNDEKRSASKALRALISILLFLLPFLMNGGESMAALLERGIEPFTLSGGAGPMGMGDAYVGVCDDSNSLFHNSAGLARTKGLAFSVKDLGNFMVAQAYPTGYGVSYGLGFIRQSIPELDYQGGQSDISTSMVVAGLGFKLQFLSDMFGAEIFRDIDLGFGFKSLLGATIRQTAGATEVDSSGTGFEGDWGFMWRASPWIKFGLTENNVLGRENGGGFVNWDTGEADEARTYTTIGLGLKVVGDRRCPVYIEDNELVISTDVSLRGEKPATLISVGAEWIYLGTYVLRAGLKQNPKLGETVTTASFGAGLRYGYWGADAAYTTDYLTDTPAFYFSFLYWPREWLFVKKPVALVEKWREEVVSESELNPELLKLSEPSEQLITDSDSVDIKGEVLKPGVKVYVNGNLAAVDDKNEFSVSFPLNMGKNLVEITTDYRGKKTIVKRKVLRKAAVLTPADLAVREKEARIIKPKEESIAKTEEDLKPREIKVDVAEKNIAEIEKTPLSETEKKALEMEKKEVKAQKEAVLAERAKVEIEKKKLAEEKKKIEEEKKRIKRDKSAIEDLATLGVIDITPDKVFESEGAITRAELASWLVKAKGIVVSEPRADPFRDVPAKSPYAGSVKAAVDAGYMKPYPDGTFRPNQPITEQEGVDTIKRFRGL